MAAVIAWMGVPCTWAGGDFTALPENPTTITVLRGGEPYLDIEFVAWGPNWAWMGIRGEVQQKDDATRLVCKANSRQSGAEIDLTADVRQTGPRQLKLDIDLRASKDTPLTYIVASITMADGRFHGGKVTASLPNGSVNEIALPLEKKGVGDALRRFALIDAAQDITNVTLTPARDAPTDGAIRVVLAGNRLAANSPERTCLTLDFPAPLTYYTDNSLVPGDPGFQNWFEFKPSNDYTTPTEIGMRDWLEKPAGKHGRIGRAGDKLIYHGKPIKLWGINLCYGACAPEKELAEKRAQFYAQYGINSVRLHKYADGTGWAGIQSKESFCELDPEGLDRMDYQVAQLKKHGIYVKLSAHFGSQKLGPGDKKYVPYLEEFGSFSGKNNRITTPHSAVHYSPELQNVQIRQTVNLLKHKNPYTGLTYAEDPAVAFIEIINEQSILFFSSMNPLKASPTLRRYVGKRFCAWLRKRYPTHAELEQAWGGPGSFDSFVGDGFPAVGERLDKDNILPLGNPWYWDPQQLATSQASRKQRLLDSLLFLYELQNEFYQRYVQAMRAAGYEGEIVSSNWQAGRAYSHFYNLHSDAMVGTVDRHNYFGGGSQSRIKNATMLMLPGSGILSSGMQQVVDHPFMLSEWIHVTPNEWGVEGPAIIGAYGMGLQGWDVSFMFQNRDNGQFSAKIGRDRWDVTAPNVLGVFPAVARQVLRGDVKESDLLATVKVHVPSLHEGKLGFEDKVIQRHDVKSLASDKVPPQALAVARCGVEFTDTYQETLAFDVAKHFHNGIYTSSTGQLHWKAGRSKLDGFFTIDTDATKGVVGFADGQRCELGDVTIQPECRYGAVYVTAQRHDENLRTSNQWLVVAVARARNTGMKIYNDDRILQHGDGPVVMEPVKARITIREKGLATVHILDHSGRKTGKTLPVTNQVFTIDGTRDKTCYYLITF